MSGDPHIRRRAAGAIVRFPRGHADGRGSRAARTMSASRSGGARFDSVLAALLAGTLAWAPLPLGSARPWAWSLLGCAAALLLILTALRDLAVDPDRPTATASGVKLWPPGLLFALVVAWAMVQTLPLDLPMTRHLAWDQAASVLGVTPLRSISLDREASTIRVFRLLTYAAFFVLAWRTARLPWGSAFLLRVIAAIGALYAFYGLLAYPSHRILWFPKRYYLDDVTATFVNRNNFATFAGLATLANLALIARCLVVHLDQSSPRAAIVSLIDQVLWRSKGALLGLIVATSALVASHSRGGTGATAIAVVMFVLALCAAPSLRATGRGLLLWIVAIVGGLVALGSGAGLLARVATVSIESDARAEVYARAAGIIYDRFWIGTGLGTFEYVYQMYQSPQLIGILDLAHNDYLENMIELGVPAALALVFVLVLLVGECLRGVLVRRRDALYPCLGIAAAALVGLHACLDFSLQIPAVTITFLTLLAIGVAQSAPSGQSAPSARPGPSALPVESRT